MSASTIIISKNRQQVAEQLASKIEQISNASISQNGIFNVGLSGASLVGLLKDGLPKISTDFSKWRLFFCDERIVSEEDPDSTYGQYKDQVIGQVNLKPEQFITIKWGSSAEEAALDYVQKMAHYFPNGTIPQFDLLLLGMGPDGHTCSLFPNHKLLDESNRWVAPITDSPKPPPARITLTYPVINNARNCVFAIFGREKADIVKKIFVDHEDLPAGRVKPTKGNLIWIMDEEAGVHIQAK